MEEKYAKNQFPVLYDKENTVAERLHQEKKFWKLGRLPGMLIVDKTGTVRFAYYSDSMKDIPKTQDVLDILKQIESDKESEQNH